MPDRTGADAARSLALHRLAAARGDGLLPAFQHLFANLDRRRGDAAVTEISRHMPHPYEQSGPNPAGSAEHLSAAGILPFPDKNTDRHQQRAQARRAGKEA